MRTEFVVPDYFMDLKTAAKRNCVSERTLRKWKDEGLKHYRTSDGQGKGAKLLFRQVDIIRFIDERFSVEVRDSEIDRQAQEIVSEIIGKLERTA